VSICANLTCWHIKGMVLPCSCGPCCGKSACVATPKSHEGKPSESKQLKSATLDAVWALMVV
jgi:hypothetical protein